jgi:hypothetical protein
MNGWLQPACKSDTLTLMCRNIKLLFNFDPPVTPEEIQAASLQFVRKISGFNKPSKANEAVFQAAVDDVAAVSTRLLRALETTAPPKNREEEAAKARARAAWPAQGRLGPSNR